VPPDYIIGDVQEPAVRAICALDSRFLADAGDPFVPACRSISGFSCSPAFEAARIDVVASPEERAKKRDLGVR
jgi:hypothetical protein